MVSEPKTPEKIYISRRLQVGTRWKQASPYAGAASIFSAEFRDAMEQILTRSGSSISVDFNEGMQGPRTALFLENIAVEITNGEQ